MQSRILSINILERFVEGMIEMKGYTYIEISQMEKVIPSFQYEPLVLIQKPKTSNEEEDRGNIDGAKPLSTRT